MRPKKVILLLDSDEDRRSITKFLLLTHAFKVSDNPTELCDLVVSSWPCNGEFIEHAHKHKVPSLVLGPEPNHEIFDLGASLCLVGLACQPFRIVEAVTTLTKRKRGPKKRLLETAVA